MTKFLSATALLIASSHLLVAAPIPADGLLIDKVWSGHPVDFAFLTGHGHQFIAYYDAERRITVAARKLGSAELVKVHPKGVPVPKRNRMSNVTGWDSHNRLKLGLDRKGHLHLSGNMHADPLVYYRTRKPLDINTLERIDRMTGEREDRVTYPRFMKNINGDMIFRYRDGGSGNGSDLYNIYDPATRTWRRLFDGPLLDGEGQRSAYGSSPRPGPDGLYHMIWMWRDTPDAMTNHTLSYARSPDLIHWETSTGQAINRPITMTQAEVIDAAKPGEGLINMTYALGFDQHKRPTVTYHRFDQNGKSQAFIARADGAGKWYQKQLSNWDFRWDFSGPASQRRQVGISHPTPNADGNLKVTFKTNAAGSGSWLINGETLDVIEQQTTPAKSMEKRPKPSKPEFPGLQTHTEKSRAEGKTWFIRWNTLGVNRDKKNRAVPPASDLRLYLLAPNSADRP